MAWKKFVEWAFLGLIGWQFSFAVSYLRQLATSIDELNTKMVLVVERISAQASMVEDHEKRLREVERKKR